MSAESHRPDLGNLEEHAMHGAMGMQTEQRTGTEMSGSFEITNEEFDRVHGDEGASQAETEYNKRQAQYDFLHVSSYDAIHDQGVDEVYADAFAKHVAGLSQGARALAKGEQINAQTMHTLAASRDRLSQLKDAYAKKHQDVDIHAIVDGVQKGAIGSENTGAASRLDDAITAYNDRTKGKTDAKTGPADKKTKKVPDTKKSGVYSFKGSELVNAREEIGNRSDTVIIPEQTEYQGPVQAGAELDTLQSDTLAKTSTNELVAHVQPTAKTTGKGLSTNSGLAIPDHMPVRRDSAPDEYEPRVQATYTRRKALEAAPEEFVDAYVIAGELTPGAKTHDVQDASDGSADNEALQLDMDQVLKESLANDKEFQKLLSNLNESRTVFASFAAEQVRKTTGKAVNKRLEDANAQYIEDRNEAGGAVAARMAELGIPADTIKSFAFLGAVQEQVDLAKTVQVQIEAMANKSIFSRFYKKWAENTKESTATGIKDIIFEQIADKGARRNFYKVVALGGATGAAISASAATLPLSGPVVAAAMAVGFAKGYNISAMRNRITRNARGFMGPLQADQQRTEKAIDNANILALAQQDVENGQIGAHSPANRPQNEDRHPLADKNKHEFDAALQNLNFKERRQARRARRQYERELLGKSPQNRESYADMMARATGRGTVAMPDVPANVGLSVIAESRRENNANQTNTVAGELTAPMVTPTSEDIGNSLVDHVRNEVKANRRRAVIAGVSSAVGAGAVGGLLNATGAGDRIGSWVGNRARGITGGRMADTASSANPFRGQTQNAAQNAAAGPRIGSLGPNVAEAASVQAAPAPKISGEKIADLLNNPANQGVDAAKLQSVVNQLIDPATTEIKIPAVDGAGLIEQIQNGTGLNADMSRAFVEHLLQKGAINADGSGGIAGIKGTSLDNIVNYSSGAGDGFYHIPRGALEDFIAQGNFAKAA